MADDRRPECGHGVEHPQLNPLGLAGIERAVCEQGYFLGVIKLVMGLDEGDDPRIGRGTEPFQGCGDRVSLLRPCEVDGDEIDPRKMGFCGIRGGRGVGMPLPTLC